MDPIAEQVASLRRETMQRHTDNVARANERHGEIVVRLERIEGKQGEDREEISALTTMVSYLKEEWQLIRKRYHELVNARQAGGDDLAVSRLDLKTAIALYVGGIGSVVAILRLMGKL